MTEGEMGRDLEEMEAVGRWMAGVRRELGGVGTMDGPLAPPSSRLQDIIRGIASGTFDEDKYIISQRVDHYVTQAIRSARRKSGEDKRDASTPTPPLPSHPTPGPLPPSPLHSSPPQHPPPLFLNSLVNRVPNHLSNPLYPTISREKSKHSNKRKNNKKGKKLQTRKTSGGEREVRQPNKNNSEVKEAGEGMSEKVPPGLRAEKPGRGSELKLGISTQTSVDILRGNTAVTLPGISISPSDSVPPTKVQWNYKLVEVVHESSSQDDEVKLSESSGEKVANGGEDTADDSDKVDQEGSENSKTHDNIRSPRFHENDNPSTRMDDEDASHFEVPSDQQAQGRENKSIFVYIVDNWHKVNPEPSGNNRFDDEVRCGVEGESEWGGVDNGHVEEDNMEDLPGYLPGIRWGEVAMDEAGVRQEVWEEGNPRVMVHEAEDRLHQHDLRLRIISRLEERLREQVRGGVAQPSPQQSPGLQVLEEDQHNQMVVTQVEAALREVVKERLIAALAEDEDGRSRNGSGLSEDSSLISLQQLHSLSLPASPLPPSKQMMTPVPSPELEAQVLPRVPTPELSQKESWQMSLEVCPTPAPSPPRLPTLPNVPTHTPALAPIPFPAHTHSFTPITSPAKLPRACTPALTPRASPGGTEKSPQHVKTPESSPPGSHSPIDAVTQPCTPSPSLSAPLSPIDIVTEPHTPLPSLPPHQMPLEPLRETLDITTGMEGQETGSKRLQDQGTQAEHLPQNILEPGSHDNHTHPITPSLVCQTSSDVTVSSILESQAGDVTFQTVSEGEVLEGAGQVLHGATSINTSLEAGELTHPTFPAPTYVSATHRKSPEYHSQQRSEGEIIWDESTECDLTGDLMGEQESVGDFGHEATVSSQDMITGSQQVSVADNESYSSGEALRMSNEALRMSSVLRVSDENDDTLRRTGEAVSMPDETRGVAGEASVISIEGGRVLNEDMAELLRQNSLLLSRLGPLGSTSIFYRSIQTPDWSSSSS